MLDEDETMTSVSIVTICYNCRDEIGPTVESVLAQTHDDIEYVVVDGDSTDGTTEWLADQREQFDVFVSEPDEGRYDAMNKGLERATGDYVMFLHAGDRLRTPSTIEDLLRPVENGAARPTILSGRIELTFDGESLGLVRPWSAGQEGPGLPHPATLVDTEVHKAHPFDDRFSYCGDYELWARLRDEGLYDVHYVDDVVTLFDVEGVSNSPAVAFSRYLERVFVDYQYTGEFGASDAATLLVVPFARQLLKTLLGQRRFVAALRYRRLLKRRL